jgi:quercetin dioxygenase-like cupin family protein
MQAFGVVILFYAACQLSAAAIDQVDAHELETVRPAFQHRISNVPGKSLVALVVNYPPGGRSLAHHHASSAFIYAYVLTGAIKSGLDGEPPQIYRAGESFHEEPGAYHQISENASESEPASLLAVFIVDTEDRPLTKSDLPPER